jgi:putative toxin-antitoxin system antitoxin component (TIGR02293 family)
MRTEGRLSADASDRLYRAAVIFYFVNLMIGTDARDVNDWMHEENHGLGYFTPMDLLATHPEADEVKAMMCRVLDGMVA